MTYQHQEDPFPDKPKSPIPPLDYSKIENKFCLYCNRHIIIQKERISDSETGKKRFRRVPRNADNDEIHECRSARIKFNDTKKESEIS
jgi:hypothetical protein